MAFAQVNEPPQRKPEFPGVGGRDRGKQFPVLTLVMGQPNEEAVAEQQQVRCRRVSTARYAHEARPTPWEVSGVWES